MGEVLVTPASSAPFTLAEAKDWCRVSGTTNDANVALWLATAVRRVEKIISQPLGMQVWKRTLPAFADVIELAHSPALTITSITYVDTTGTGQTVDPAIYTLDMVSNPARVVRNSAASWPVHRGNAEDAIEISYEVGYDDVSLQETEIPAAVATLTALWFEERGATPTPPGVMELLSTYRRILI